MARWQRDPRARKRLATILVATEVLLAAIVFLLLAYNYIVRLAFRVAPGLAEHGLLIAGILTVLFLAWLIYQAMMYVRGIDWARKAFIAINIVLFAAGALWFVADLLTAQQNPDALVQGLCLPLITVFPITGFLLAFRPTVPRHPPGRA